MLCYWKCVHKNIVVQYVSLKLYSFSCKLNLDSYVNKVVRRLQIKTLSKAFEFLIDEISILMVGDVIWHSNSFITWCADYCFIFLHQMIFRLTNIVINIIHKYFLSQVVEFYKHFISILMSMRFQLYDNSSIVHYLMIIIKFGPDKERNNGSSTSRHQRLSCEDFPWVCYQNGRGPTTSVTDCLPPEHIFASSDSTSPL